MKWFRKLYGQLSLPRKQSARRRASFRPQLEAFEKPVPATIPRLANSTETGS